MTVYVDDMARRYVPPHRRGRTYVMSHMAADAEDELHAMADAIGVARRWFQVDHYDVCASKRLRAIALGARAVTQREMARMIVNRRRTVR